MVWVTGITAEMYVLCVLEVAINCRASNGLLCKLERGACLPKIALPDVTRSICL